MKTSICTSKDHRDKIKVPDPVVKDRLTTTLCDRLIEVKYNKISQLGILNEFNYTFSINGRRNVFHLSEFSTKSENSKVKFTVNRGTDFWEFEKCPFNRG